MPRSSGLGNACRDFVERVKEIRENEHAQCMSAVRGAVSKALEDLGLGDEVGALALQAALEREMGVGIREVEFLDDFLDHQTSGMPGEFHIEALMYWVETLLQEFSRRELLITMREIRDRELCRRNERVWRAILKGGELHFLFIDVDARPWCRGMPSNAEIHRILNHAGLSPDNTIVVASRRRGGAEEYTLAICGEHGYPQLLPLLSPCHRKLREGAGVRLYIHDVRCVPKEKPSLSAGSGLQGLYDYKHLSACLGRTRSELLEGLLHWDRSMTREYFGCWLRECWKRLREKGKLTEKEAKRILDNLADEIGQAERRSLELLRSTVGGEAVEQLLKLGYLIVDSANGRKYRITHDGEVFDVATGRSVCVMIDEEGELPIYDDILAKYLVIRDHPEQIETLEPEENEFREVPENLLKEICARGGISIGELLERIDRVQADLAYQVTRLGAVLLAAKELGVELCPKS